MTCHCPTCGAALADDDTIRVDSETGIIVARGHVAMLTKQEAALFDVLWSGRGRVLTKEQLLAATADPAFDDREIKIVDVIVCKTRKKLKPLGIEIGTAWGRGYRIVGGRNHE